MTRPRGENGFGRPRSPLSDDTQGAGTPLNKRASEGKVPPEARILLVCVWLRGQALGTVGFQDRALAARPCPPG